MIRIAVIILFSLLSACQSYTPPSSSTNALPANWSLSGKLGYRGSESGSATITWRYADSNHLINLSGPFGSYATQITGNASNLSIRTDEVLMTGPAEIIMLEQLGWSTPIDAWPFWLNGEPAPDKPATNYQRTSSQVSFTQDGTHVQLDRFRMIDGYTLAHRIICERDGQRITLLVSSWNLGV